MWLASFVAISFATFSTVYEEVFSGWYLSPFYWVIGFLAQVVIYTILVLTTINTVYNLIHILPDRVLRWIGGGDAPLGDMGAHHSRLWNRNIIDHLLYFVMGYR